MPIRKGSPSRGEESSYRQFGRVQEGLTPARLTDHKPVTAKIPVHSGREREEAAQAIAGGGPEDPVRLQDPIAFHGGAERAARGEDEDVGGGAQRGEEEEAEDEREDS